MNLLHQRLLKACLKELKSHSVEDKNITTCWVPGAFEIPVVALRLAKKKNIDAVICIGAVIKGETDHYDLVAKGVTYGITQASLMTEKPIIFNVLATETVEQANKRSEEKGINKGQDAALAAIDMVQLLSQLK